MGILGKHERGRVGAPAIRDNTTAIRDIVTLSVVGEGADEALVGIIATGDERVRIRLRYENARQTCART